MDLLGRQFCPWVVLLPSELKSGCAVIRPHVVVILLPSGIDHDQGHDWDWDEHESYNSDVSSRNTAIPRVGARAGMAYID